MLMNSLSLHRQTIQKQIQTEFINRQRYEYQLNNK
jgi:hypothetical protein